MENTILENLVNIAVVDNAKRDKILLIIPELIASEINVLVLASKETTDLYRQLHDRHNGKYLAQIDDFNNYKGECKELEIISGDYLASALFNKKVTSVDLATFLCKKIQYSGKQQSFLIIDDIYAVGNEYLKSCIATIFKNPTINQIYLGLIFDSVDRALANTSKYCQSATLILDN
jgi:hypothetical protein